MLLNIGDTAVHMKNLGVRLKLWIEITPNANIYSLQINLEAVSS